ncbi:hypothetical protein FKM82_027656 [Ascaphus truei]
MLQLAEHRTLGLAPHPHSNNPSKEGILSRIIKRIQTPNNNNEKPTAENPSPESGPPNPKNCSQLSFYTSPPRQIYRSSLPVPDSIPNPGFQKLFLDNNNKKNHSSKK